MYVSILWSRPHGPWLLQNSPMIFRRCILELGYLYVKWGQLISY
jgi:hypothetical protein